MTLIENMDFIREAIKSLEYPSKIPKDTLSKYSEIFKWLCKADENSVDYDIINREFTEDFMPYFDRFKEEEEEEENGRYTKKRVRFKV